MSNKLYLAFAGFGLLLASKPVAGHHAFAAEFDVSKPVKVRGSITKVEWVNPHAWIYVDVKDADGKVVNWHFELAPPTRCSGWAGKRTPSPLEPRWRSLDFAPRTGRTWATAAPSFFPTAASCSPAAQGRGRKARQNNSAAGVPRGWKS